ncbi:rhomboid family intramembrane serine protease, partial [Halorubrum sp. E3]
AAVVLTATTAAPGVALIAHGTGAFCGLVAGRTRLLDAR